MDKKYFHEMSNDYKQGIILFMSFNRILHNFKQPDWCGKLDALNGLFGCNKLLGLTCEITTEESCSKCKFFKND